MSVNFRKLLMGFVLTVMLLPMIAMASSEFKGTETVNINKANAATLAAYLKGIGANKAEAIVKYRRSNGNFKSAADIKNVPGVGEATYKDIKSRISTSRGKSTAPKGYKIGETSGKSTSSKRKSSTKSSKSTTKKSSSDTKSAAKKSTTSKSKSTKVKKDSKAKKTASSKTSKSASSKKTAKKKPTSKKTSSKSKATTKKPIKKKKPKKKKKSS